MRMQAFAAFSLLFLMGCATRGTVRIPSEDATPPWSALDVVGDGLTMVLMVGGEPGIADLNVRDSLILIAMGGDGDGGVKDISLSGNALVTCKEEATGKLKTRTAAFKRMRVGSLRANARAPGEKSTRFTLRASDFRNMCPGQGLAAVVGQATARSVNFHGGSAASPRLEFRFDAAGPADTSALEPHPKEAEAPAPPHRST